MLFSWNTEIWWVLARKSGDSVNVDIPRYCATLEWMCSGASFESSWAPVLCNVTFCCLWAHKWRRSIFWIYFDFTRCFSSYTSRGAKPQKRLVVADLSMWDGEDKETEESYDNWHVFRFPSLPRYYPITAWITKRTLVLCNSTGNVEILARFWRRLKHRGMRSSLFCDKDSHSCFWIWDIYGQDTRSFIPWFCVRGVSR